MSLLPNSSHSVSLQVIVSAIENIYSVINMYFNRVDFLIYFLPKMIHSHILAYRDR
jgi:hypothetical protein